MQAPVDDRAELVNDSLRHWKPVKSLIVGVMLSNFHFRIVSRAAE